MVGRLSGTRLMRRVWKRALAKQDNVAGIESTPDRRLVNANRRRAATNRRSAQPRQHPSLPHRRILRT